MMKAFSVLHRRWNHWWLRQGPPHGIAILRIVFGAYLLLFFGLRLPHVPILFSEEGLTLSYDLSLPAFLQPLLAPPSALTAWIIFALMLGSLAAFTIGLATRTSATISALLYLYYLQLSFHQGMTSYVRLFLFLLLLFTFSDAGKAFSFEMWRKHGSFAAWEPGSILTQRLIALQITATYVGVAWQKTWLPDWQEGEVLLYSFQSMWATPVAWWFVQQDIPLWVYDAWVEIVKYLEVAFPIGFWIPKLRPWAFAAGALFHGLIALFLSAMWWFTAMIACYIMFFEPEDVERTLRRDTP